LFAVGVLLYEMLTGRRLFRAEDELQTMALVRACQVTPPSHVNPDITPELEAVTMRALARNPRDRYAHADDMMADIAPLLHDLRWGARETMGILQRLVPAETMSEPTGTKSASAWVARGSSNSAPTSLTPVGAERPVWPLVAIAVLTVALAASVTLAFTRSRPRQPRAIPLVTTPIAAPPTVTPTVIVQPTPTPPPTKETPSPIVVQPTAHATAEPEAPAVTDGEPRAHATKKKKAATKHHALDLERGDVLDKL
ncbi:MAG TPA: hypothetical protein VIA18_02650, partial [Polyangia bacterium]|nr:hypothetical protein [Polyangia bacterium]